MQNKNYKNPEGYSDPTPGEAMKRAMRGENKRKTDANRLIAVLKKTARLAGFEIVSRIILKDTENGGRYK